MNEFSYKYSTAEVVYKTKEARKEGYQQAIQEVLDILKAEGWVGVVYKRIEALKEGK